MLSKIKYLMEKKKIQNNVQTICSNIMNIHFIYVYAYKCIYVCNTIYNITYTNTHTCIFGRRLGKGCRRKTLFNVYFLPRIFFHVYLQPTQKHLKRLQPTNQSK